MQRLAGKFNNELAMTPASTLSAFVLQLMHLPLHQPVLFLGLLRRYLFLLPFALSNGLHRVRMQVRRAACSKATTHRR